MSIHEEILKDNKGCVLENFKLKNRDEIIDFINKHNGLLELIEKVYPLVRKYFPTYSLSLKFYEDPESYDLDCICLDIYGNFNIFEKDYYTLNHLLENDIDELIVSKPESKLYLSVDLVYPF